MPNNRVAPLSDGAAGYGYQPCHGDILTQNGVKVRVILATGSRVIFSVNILGESKGTFFKTRQEFLADVLRFRPKLERGQQVTPEPTPAT